MRLATDAPSIELLALPPAAAALPSALRLAPDAAPAEPPVGSSAAIAAVRPYFTIAAVLQSNNASSAAASRSASHIQHHDSGV